MAFKHEYHEAEWNQTNCHDKNYKTDHCLMSRCFWWNSIDTRPGIKKLLTEEKKLISLIMEHGEDHVFYFMIQYLSLLCSPMKSLSLQFPPFAMEKKTNWLEKCIIEFFY